MTIDLYDDVLMPFIIGLIIISGFIMIGVLVYMLIEGKILAFILIMSILILWAIGFPIWRRHIYG